MKKLLFLGLGLFATLTLAKPVATLVVKAQDQEEIVSSVVQEQEEQPIEEVEEELKGKIEGVLSEYFTWDYVSEIVNWMIDAGLLSIIAVLMVKYRKYKGKTIDELADMMKNEIKKEIKLRFDESSKEQQEKLLNSFDKLIKDIDTIKKAMVFVQDKTAEGKVALLNLISQTTDDKEIKKSIDEVKEKIEEEQKIVDEVKSKVDGDYKEIF